MNIIDVMEQVSSTLFLIIKNDKVYVFDSYRENDSSYDFGVYSVHPVEDLKNGKMSIDDIPDLYLNDYFDFLLHEDFEATYNVTSAEISKLRSETFDRWADILKEDGFEDAYNVINELCEAIKNDCLEPLSEEKINSIRNQKNVSYEFKCIEKFEAKQQYEKENE